MLDARSQKGFLCRATILLWTVTFGFYVNTSRIIFLTFTAIWIKEFSEHRAGKVKCLFFYPLRIQNLSQSNSPVRVGLRVKGNHP